MSLNTGVGDDEHVPAEYLARERRVPAAVARHVGLCGRVRRPDYVRAGVTAGVLREGDH